MYGQNLSFSHTFPLKSAHVGGCPPNWLAPSPPMGNPGSTAGNIFSLTLLCIAVTLFTHKSIISVNNQLTPAVVDPGFPIGGVLTSDVGAFRQKRM